ncbi:MAG: hypothetical protein H0U57_08095 [Tatlockia sp.]|nr:hypothetical protein [Tatlockia sp.]
MPLHLDFSFSDLIPIVISTVVFTILIFSLYVTIKYKDTEQYKKTRLNVFFSTLASVAIIFVGINIMLSSIAFEYNQQFTRLTRTKEAVDKLWLYPNELLKTSKNIRPEFKASFFLNSASTYNLVDSSKITPLTTVAIVQEQFIANVMIQSWEDCLADLKYDLTPFEIWLRSYLTWAQSPYLKEYYQLIKYGYDDTTNQFADLLFEYAATLPIPIKNPDIYITTVDQLMKDPRYISLMKALR